MSNEDVKVLGQITKIENKRNGSNTYKEIKLMIPTGQGSMSDDDRVTLDHLYEDQKAINVILTPSNRELWPKGTDENANQGSLKIDDD